MDAAKVLQTLISLSERSANVARAVRKHSDLFQTLVQDKEYDKRRQKPDFKTLADVTIQETIRYFLGKEFPYLASQVRGEESYSFTNKNGNFVNIQASIMPSPDLMKELLRGVLQGDDAAAAELVQAIYTEPDVKSCEGFALDRTAAVDLTLATDNFGIWVDPLDATAEYVSGKGSEKLFHGVFLSGLHCVTILIGVFDLKTGEPVMGVINQPFFEKDETTQIWKSRCVWGLSYAGQRAHSGIRSIRPQYPESAKPQVVIMSGSETDAIKEALDECFTTIYAAGAGYKFLSLTLGLADAYILSRATTFKWDSCAPHAILRAIGGGVCDLSKALIDFDLQFVENNRKYELQYLHPDDPDAEIDECWLNAGGILAYANIDALTEIVTKLRQVMADGLQQLDD
ncbi:Inositol polyphosphate 1-phosphatase [Hypsibius exemplaris]|uniref:Inositol polyphosphate 1-phosphatase n=1 Tax=Hypsibius exemplaris TaxID=2072580 RepID=A0A1W0WVH3_HYPEX|nr:Inositol polyphosphate 1-phosphatase [Hypsibius exemplaris]